MLGQQVVEQTDVLQPQSSHVYVTDMFLQKNDERENGYILIRNHC